VRINPAVAADVKFHWGWWINRALSRSGQSALELGRRIAPDKADAGSYAQLVKRWGNHEKAVSPRLAFEVGENLRDLGAEFLSGPAALYGASYIEDAIGVCALMLRASEKTAPAVVSILFASPNIFEDEASLDDKAWRRLVRTLLAQGQFTERSVTEAEVDSFIEAGKERAAFARAFCAKMNGFAGSAYQAAWDAWIIEKGKGKPKLDRFSVAYTIAKDRSRLWTERRRVIHAELEDWAARSVDKATQDALGIRLHETFESLLQKQLQKQWVPAR